MESHDGGRADPTVTRRLTPGSMHPAPGVTDRSFPLIAICIPTYRRNEMLRDCLHAMKHLRVPAGYRIEIAVVDNDAEGSAEAVCAALRETLPFSLHYGVEPERGLASVRNRLLHEALRMDARWIAFIDDDEMAGPEWLIRHMRALGDFHAEVSSGPVVLTGAGSVFDERDPARRPTGSTPRHIACNNVVLSSRLARDQRLRFDPRFNFIGGEDFDFFESSQKSGNVHVWCVEAVVSETVPPERATWRYLFKRHFSGATNSVVRYRKYHGRTGAWLHFTLKAAGKLIGAGGSLLCACLYARRRHARTAVKRLANALGYFCGLLNLSIERYR